MAETALYFANAALKALLLYAGLLLERTVIVRTKGVKRRWIPMFPIYGVLFGITFLFSVVPFIGIDNDMWVRFGDAFWWGAIFVRSIAIGVTWFLAWMLAGHIKAPKLKFAVVYGILLLVAYVLITTNFPNDELYNITW